MPFELSYLSLAKLLNVRPELQKVVKRALQLTTVDFSVVQGLRTIEEQQADVAAGKSRTMQSRHLTGCAVDLMAYVGGKGSWDHDLYLSIAKAMKQASLELAIPLTWGAVWDRALGTLGDDLGAEVKAYAARQAAVGKTALADLDHFELNRAAYR